MKEITAYEDNNGKIHKTEADCLIQEAKHEIDDFCQGSVLSQVPPEDVAEDMLQKAAHLSEVLSKYVKYTKAKIES